MTAMSDEQAMRRALGLAARGPVTGGNPQVGCVILSPDGETIAEGWHHGAGTPHAEVDALSKLPEGGAQGATAVVTLEPCNHYGRTGPCSEALIAAGVARVVYAVSDPGHESGGGAARLREAGVEVTSGVLAEDISAFLEPWLVAVRRGRPYLRLKWASSLDGRVAASDGTSKWITGATARRLVHAQRADSDAILVGTGTVLADDPSLTARGDGGELLVTQPVPVVVGRSDLPGNAAVLRHPRGVILERDHDLDAVLRGLFARGIRTVYAEGGPRIASALVTAGLVDEYLIYLAPMLLGGPRTALDDVGVASIGERRPLAITDIERLGNDVLITARPAREGV
jgi:diaminohydroxyphosphoribosylaminopyrimidine deaminase/5-amino-6-(5-phosphoribosylamino)uracil reductase